jgi:hypothetical protein
MTGLAACFIDLRFRNDCGRLRPLRNWLVGTAGKFGVLTAVTIQDHSGELALDQRIVQATAWMATSLTSERINRRRR